MGYGLKREKGAYVEIWPLHDIAIANIVWCIAYKRGVRTGGVYCAVVGQYICNSVCITGGGGQINDDWLVRKSDVVNEYLVKAKLKYV